MLLLQTVVRGGEVQGAGVQQLSAAAGRGPRQPAGLRPLGGAQAAPGGYNNNLLNSVEHNVQRKRPYKCPKPFLIACLYLIVSFNRIISAKGLEAF